MVLLQAGVSADRGGITSFSMSACDVSGKVEKRRMGRSFYFTMIMFLAILPTAGAVAANGNDQDRARALSSAGTIVPLGNITSQLRDRRIDHILEVELESDDSGHYYDIEALDDEGRVRKLKYDATTGQLLGEQDDD